MENIYDWLLHNMGNEGNYLTVLNTQPHREDEHIRSLEVMARTKNFEVLNLIINASHSLNVVGSTEERVLEKEYRFSNTEQAIAYLSDGSEPDSVKNDNEPVFYLYVTKPKDGSDSITFPSRQY